MKKLLAILAICVLGLTANVLAQADKSLGGLSLRYLAALPTERSANPPMIILLHGYGSNEEDLFGLRTRLPENYIVISARAPLKADVGGYQWFNREIVNGKYTGRKQDLENSRKALIKFIGEAVAKYHADPKRVILGGFSQGAMMCYEVGLTAPGKVKGIGVLSGKIPESLLPRIDKSAAAKKLSIFIAHGTADSRLPYADSKSAYDTLTHLGFRVHLHSYSDMDHTISNEVIVDLAKWLSSPARYLR